MVPQIKLCGEMGGPEGEPQIAYFHHLLDLIDDHASDAYAPSLLRLSCFFQLDGSMKSFGYEGPRRLRFYNKKNPYMALEIGVPKKRWNAEPAKVKLTYSEYLRTAFKMFSDRAKKEGIEFDHENFLRDTETVLDRFLKEQTRPYRSKPLPVALEDPFSN